jgi:predicted thioredoxin/glutaredoxin
MAQRKKIEIYSAGCHTCREAVKMVKMIAGEEHDVEVLDMHQPHVVVQATRHGIRSVPSVVVDGHLAACCAGRGVDEAVLRAAIA